MRLLSVLLLTLAGVAPAFSWGCEAHEMMALVTRAHLTPVASKAVDDLLSAHPIDPSLSRFCRNRPADLMADSATWADDVRARIDDPWHYIDLPLNIIKPVADITPWCSPIDPAIRGGQASGCVTTAIDFNRKILEDRTRSVADRADALRFVIHFFGDITQPLHNSGDTGGNCTAIFFYDQTRPSTVHTAWDSGILTHIRNRRKISSQALFDELDHKFAQRGKTWMRAKIDPVAWTWESHKPGVEVAFGDLSPRIPPEISNMVNACDAEKARVEALNIHIGDTYVNQAWPVIEEQMMKAAYRLAGYLNRTFK
jgi:hypothetical protein